MNAVMLPRALPHIIDRRTYLRTLAEHLPNTAYTRQTRARAADACKTANRRL